MLRKSLVGAALAVVVLGVGAGHAAAPFSEIISFGDSLSDVGNSAAITIDGDMPRIDGYYQQTHYTDNLTWVELLAGYWGLPARTVGRGDTNALTPQPNGNDWAWGGAEAGTGTVQPTGVTQPIPNLLTQTAQYLNYNTPDPDALFTIWSGADNLLVGKKFGPEAAADAAGAVKTAMQNLAAAGAQNFLVFNLPALGDTPGAQAEGELTVLGADAYSDAYNLALNLAIDELNDDPSFLAQIHKVDVYTELSQAVGIVNGGGVYTPSFFVPGGPVSIGNVTDTGISYFDANGTFPTDYLFWDVVHPTAQGHEIIAGLALQALPEPGTYLLVAGGIAMVALVNRRKSTREGAAVPGPEPSASILLISGLAAVCARRRRNTV